MRYKYELQIKETIYMSNILGNHSMPVPTYRWKGIALGNNKEELEKLIENKDKNEYRIEDRGVLDVK